MITVLSIDMYKVQHNDGIFWLPSPLLFYMIILSKNHILIYYSRNENEILKVWSNKVSSIYLFSTPYPCWELKVCWIFLNRTGLIYRINRFYTIYGISLEDYIVNFFFTKLKLSRVCHRTPCNLQLRLASLKIREIFKWLAAERERERERSFGRDLFHLKIDQVS